MLQHVLLTSCIMVFGSSVAIKLQNTQLSTLLFAISVSNNGIRNNFLSTQKHNIRTQKKIIINVILDVDPKFDHGLLMLRTSDSKHRLNRDLLKIHYKIFITIYYMFILLRLMSSTYSVIIQIHEKVQVDISFMG